MVDGRLIVFRNLRSSWKGRCKVLRGLLSRRSRLARRRIWATLGELSRALCGLPNTNHGVRPASPNRLAASSNRHHCGAGRRFPFGSTRIPSMSGSPVLGRPFIHCSKGRTPAVVGQQQRVTLASARSSAGKKYITLERIFTASTINASVPIQAYGFLERLEAAGN